MALFRLVSLSYDTFNIEAKAVAVLVVVKEDNAGNLDGTPNSGGFSLIDEVLAANAEEVTFEVWREKARTGREGGKSP